MLSIPLLTARPVAPVAAVFGDPHRALYAANDLRRQDRLRGQSVEVLYPDDPHVQLKMQRLALAGPAVPKRRPRLSLSLRAAVAAAVVAALVFIGGFWAAVSSTYVVIAAALLGATIALGLVTLLKPTSAEGEVVDDVEQALRQGHWAVVTHPDNARTANVASASLRRNGGEILHAF